MTVREAIARVDALRPNACPDSEKVRWLLSLDGMIRKNIIDTHGDPDTVPAGEGEDATLAVPQPYEDVYLFWLEAKIDLEAGESASYADSRTAFESAYSTFAEYYNRTHPPKGGAVKFV